MATKNSGDLIDEKGHTKAQAKAQEPLLDTGAPAASQETPVAGGDVMVPAQTPEEVQAQIENRAGTGEESDEERYGADTGTALVAPLTDDRHGRDDATSAADRDPLKDRIRNANAVDSADAAESTADTANDGQDA